MAEKFGFQNMDEVDSYVKQLNESNMDPELRDGLLFILGRLPNQGISVPVVIDKKEVALDRHIAGLVSALNEAGIRTLASCSGLRREHQETIWAPKGCGYIAFAYTEDLHHLLEEHLAGQDGFEVTVGKCYFEQCVTVRVRGSDEELEHCWSLIEALLLPSGGMIQKG